MNELDQALPPCDHALFEINWIIFPCFKWFFLKMSMQGVLVVSDTCGGDFFCKKKDMVLQMLM